MSQRSELLGMSWRWKRSVERNYNFHKLVSSESFFTHFLRHRVSTDITKRINIWAVQLNHIQVIAREYSCTIDSLSVSKCRLELIILSLFKAEINVTNLGSVNIWFTNIQMCVGRLWYIVLSSNSDWFV